MLKIAPKILGLSLAFFAATASAQNWPTRPVRVLVGYGAGGVTDVVVRIVSEDVSKRLGQPFVIENRPSVNGIVAANAVKVAQADGYTLFGGSATQLSSVFMKDNPIDAPKQLTPISLLALGDQFVFVRADLGVNSIKDLVAKAKASPNRLRLATLAATQNMLMAVVAKQAGFEYENIPYKSADQITAALLTGDCDFTLTALPGMPPHLQSGKIRAVATLGSTRSALTPNVATLKEQGAKVEFMFNLGYWGPPATPRDVVVKLGSAVAEANKSQGVIEKVRAAAMEPMASSPEDLVKEHNSEMVVYTEAAALTGTQPQ